MPYVRFYRGTGRADARMVYEHREVAAKALGRPLPPKAQVHHFDGDGLNNRNGNLVICQDRAYHALLEARHRIVRAGGDPDEDRWCCKCQRPRPLSTFTRRRKDSAGKRAGQVVSVCRECHKEARRARPR